MIVGKRFFSGKIINLPAKQKALRGEQGFLREEEKKEDFGFIN